MYRLTIKGKKLQWHESTYDTINTENHYNCDTIMQLMGLLEFLVQTSENEIDCTIARKEDDDE